MPLQMRYIEQKVDAELRILMILLTLLLFVCAAANLLRLTGRCARRQQQVWITRIETRKSMHFALRSLKKLLNNKMVARAFNKSCDSKTCNISCCPYR